MLLKIKLKQQNIYKKKFNKVNKTYYIYIHTGRHPYTIKIKFSGSIKRVFDAQKTGSNSLFAFRLESIANAQSLPIGHFGTVTDNRTHGQLNKPRWEVVGISLLKLLEYFVNVSLTYIICKLFICR